MNLPNVVARKTLCPASIGSAAYKRTAAVRTNACAAIYYRQQAAPLIEN
jgi:hypothetical protein